MGALRLGERQFRHLAQIALPALLDRLPADGNASVRGIDHDHIAVMRPKRRKFGDVERNERGVVGVDGRLYRVGIGLRVARRRKKKAPRRTRQAKGACLASWVVSTESTGREPGLDKQSCLANASSVLNPHEETH